MLKAKKKSHELQNKKKILNEIKIKYVLYKLCNLQ